MPDSPTEVEEKETVWRVFQLLQQLWQLKKYWPFVALALGLGTYSHQDTKSTSKHVSHETLWNEAGDHFQDLLVMIRELQADRSNQQVQINLLLSARNTN